MLLLLFAGSGCAALIYEIVALQLLELYVGASAASVAILLGTFMGGLCVGSLLFARLVPRGVHNLLDSGLDWMSQDPGPSSAVLQGLFFGRIAPPRSERALLETRTLVIGHPRDPVHPFSDADELARELRNARLVDANSILELRIAPERLTNEIARFIDDCWRPTAAERARPRARSANGRRRASA